MGAHNLAYRMTRADFEVPDPGNGAALPNDRGFCVINVVTGASGETNTVADPIKSGQQLTVFMKTDGGGDRVITFASDITQESGQNAITLADAGDSFTVTSGQVGSAFKWRLSSPTVGSGISELETEVAASYNAPLIQAADVGNASGVLEVFPVTFAKGKIRVKAVDNADNYILDITNAELAAARTYTLPDAGGAADFVMTAGTQTIAGAKTFSTSIAPASVIRTSYKIVSAPINAKAGATAGWVVGAGDNVFTCTIPQSQSGSTLVIPVTGLHVGDTITAFGLLGQIESAGGAVTVDGELRKQTAAAADVTDATVASMTQIAVTADTAINATQDKGSLTEVVAATTSYYILVTCTTAATTDAVIHGYSITVTTA